MPAGDSIRYKSVVVGLLSILLGLMSSIGGWAVVKLENVATAVTTMQATQALKDAKIQELSSKVERMSERMDTMDRQLQPQIVYLTQWLDRTFGRVPDQSGGKNPQFGK